MSYCNDMPSTMLVQPATTANNNCGMGWGGDWSTWIIIFVLLFSFCGWGGGGGFGGNAGNAMQGALTRQDLCQDMNFQNLDNAVRSGVAENNSNFRAVDNAICTLGYQTAQLANGLQMQVANGFGQIDTSLCQLGNNIANQSHAGQIAQLQGQNAIQSQIADCCCQTRYDALQTANATQGAIRDGFCQTNYNVQNNTRDIIEAQNASTRAILDKLTSQELAAKDAQIAAQSQALFAAELRASQEAQNTYLINRLAPCPIPAYPACPGQYQWQSVNNNCCGCGC